MIKENLKKKLVYTLIFTTMLSLLFYIIFVPTIPNLILFLFIWSWGCYFIEKSD